MNFIKFDKFGPQFDLDDIETIGVRDYEVVVVCTSGIEVCIYSANTVFEATYMAEKFTASVIEQYKQSKM